MASLFKVAAIAGILALVVFKSSTAHTAIATTTEPLDTAAGLQAMATLGRGEPDNVRTAGVIKVTGEVAAVTLIIVDEDGLVTETWSSSGGKPSKVVARQGSRTGPEVAVPSFVLRGANGWPRAKIRPGTGWVD